MPLRATPAGVVLQHAIEQAGSIDPEKVAAALKQPTSRLSSAAYKFSTDPAHHGLQTRAPDGAGAMADGERQARPPSGLAADAPSPPI